MKKKCHACHTYRRVNRQAGFSLIELLVVVVIVLIMTGIGSYAIGRFNRMKEATETRDYVADRLKLARNLSITNQLPDKSVDLKYVKVTLSENNLIVEGMKNNESVGTTETPYFSEKLDDDADQSQIQLTNNSIGVTSFGFLGKNGRLTDSSGELNNGPLLIKISNQYGDYSLTINDLGSINEE